MNGLGIKRQDNCGSNFADPRKAVDRVKEKANIICALWPESVGSGHIDRCAGRTLNRELAIRQRNRTGRGQRASLCTGYLRG